MTITVINFQYKVPSDAVVIDTTSRSSNWSAGLSPFFVGPVDLYGDYKSHNVENGWQYSKLFAYYADENGDPTDRYFKWAQEGWSKIRADRYPMGKGIVPLCSIWNGEKLDYISARKKIYIPLYKSAVENTFAFNKLKEIYKTGEPLYLRDFDAHNLQPGAFSYDKLWDNPNIKVGHAYVLAMMLENKI